MKSDAQKSAEQEFHDPSEFSLGALHGEVWLTIQTYQAQSLIRGRRAADDKPAIIGLVGFAERLKILWQAVRLDDPYADWWLLKIEEGIAACRSRLQGLQEQLETLLTACDGLEINSAQSSRPQRVALQFANPYAFRAAQMLADYDQLVCTAMTCRHLGIELPGDLALQVNASGRWLRRVFALPQGYHGLELTRGDFIRGTLRAENARERMGALPQEILSGDRLPSLRPTAFYRSQPLKMPPPSEA
ncbi:MAG: TIGR03761 family integrating conjugative element protein [Gammaproteobacteria bacterium]|nr:TIGR03761 family integrating conjugative element protein [Gammaproteobacteria bacterium]